MLEQLVDCNQHAVGRSAIDHVMMGLYLRNTKGAMQGQRVADRTLLTVRSHDRNVTESPGHIGQEAKSPGVNSVVVRAKYAGWFLATPGVTSWHRSQI